MKITFFFRDKLSFLLVQGFLIIFVSVLLTVYQADVFAVLFTGVVFALITVGSIGIEYFKKKRYYHHLVNTLAQIDKKQYISSVLEKPTFAEAELWCDVLRQVTKSMNDEIAKYQIENEEYRDYIEAWIHEVKTPISCISLICENAQSKQMLSVQEEVSKIDYFVEQALFYARSTAVEKDYSIHTIALNEVVKSVVKKHSKPLIAAHCAIRIENLDYTVYSDEKWLAFILGQIIINAVKYRREHLELIFSGTESEKNIMLTIQDNGIGIPESDIGRVFEKGFTGVNGRRFGKSTGIGLYLCQRLCEKMHLGIAVHSQGLHGTTVTITFPKDKVIMFE